MPLNVLYFEIVSSSFGNKPMTSKSYIFMIINNIITIITTNAGKNAPNECVKTYSILSYNYILFFMLLLKG